MAESPKITIDDVVYNYDDLTEKQKNIIGNMRYAANKISELNMDLSQYEAAMITYKLMLEKETNATSEDNA